MEISYLDYVISDDPAKLDLTTIKQFLERSYWASSRSFERITTSIEHSLNFGIYKDGAQVGFARVVTDYATMYWLCDVFIDEQHRGHGLGKKLVETVTTCEQLKELMGLLGTRDAHELYEQYSFVKDPDRFMRKPPSYTS